MPLVHNFYIHLTPNVTSKTVHDRAMLSRCVGLHDDVVQYMYDTWIWLPTMSAGNKVKGLTPHMGLIYEADTIIEPGSFPLMKAIVRSWRNLFACGPETIVLTEYKYSQIIDRDATCACFDALIENIEYAAREGLPIIHHGL